MIDSEIVYRQWTNLNWNSLLWHFLLCKKIRYYKYSLMESCTDMKLIVAKTKHWDELKINLLLYQMVLTNQKIPPLAGPLLSLWTSFNFDQHFLWALRIVCNSKSFSLQFIFNFLLDRFSLKYGQSWHRTFLLPQYFCAHFCYRNTFAPTSAGRRYLLVAIWILTAIGNQSLLSCALFCLRRFVCAIRIRNRRVDPRRARGSHFSAGHVGPRQFDLRRLYDCSVIWGCLWLSWTWLNTWFDGRSICR